MNNYIHVLNINYEDRKLLCKMSVSDHFLEIERGRYTRIKKENRICKFCDLKEVEDEFHFIFSCKNNHTLRNILYKDINSRRADSQFNYFSARGIFKNPREIIVNIFR